MWAYSFGQDILQNLTYLRYFAILYSIGKMSNLTQHRAWSGCVPTLSISLLPPRLQIKFKTTKCTTISSTWSIFNVQNDRKEWWTKPIRTWTVAQLRVLPCDWRMSEPTRTGLSSDSIADGRDAGSGRTCNAKRLNAVPPSTRPHSDKNNLCHSLIHYHLNLKFILQLTQMITL